MVFLALLLSGFFVRRRRWIKPGLTGNLAIRLPFRVCRGKVLRRAVCPPAMVIIA
jgi:hypothetical protein